MEIYLRHDQHGRKIAYDFREAEEDKKYGWEQITKSEFFKVTKGTKEEKDKAERDELIQKYMDKFGKAPHGRMSASNIEKALLEDSNDSSA